MVQEFWLVTRLVLFEEPALQLAWVPPCSVRRGSTISTRHLTRSVCSVNIPAGLGASCPPALRSGHLAGRLS